MAKNKKVIKKQKKLYRELQDLHEEMSDFLSDVLDEQRRDSKELRYLKDFIHYQKLEKEYLYFRRNGMRKRTVICHFHTSPYNN